MKFKSYISLLFFLFISIISKEVSAQTVLNDGRIRLRVWIHKVWTNANCDDLGDQEYVFRGIKVRPNSDITAIGWSPTGLNIRADGDENRWWSRAEWAGLQTPGGNANFPMTLDANGVLMMDVTYNTTQVPKYFDWSIQDMWEDDNIDCPFPCDGGTNQWIFNPSFCCGALGDDNYVGYNQEIAVASFRGAPEGEIRYVQTTTFGFGEQESYSLLFAYQWDWVDPLPPLPDASTNEPSGGVRYQDGPVTLQADLMGIFGDIDYDYGLTCTFGFADNEDIRLNWRATDNLNPFAGGAACVNSLSQPTPRWNTGNPITTLFNKTYTTADTEFESFNLEFELWEEDGCGSDCAYETNCFLGIENDDAYLFATTGPINWRNSIPTYAGQPDQWNYIDFPVRTSGSSYVNWSVRVRYKWVQAAPVISGAGPFDRTLCLGTPTKLSTTASSTTYYQWQVADPPAVTGPAGPTCPPANTVWTDIPGAYYKEYTPPQTPGTRIYRCVAKNRTGEGSYTSTGPKFRETYSECYRITYFPYAPPIVSNACGSSIVGGVAYPFSVAVEPEPNAVANAVSYTWSVNPPTGVVISNPTSTSTTITFPQSDNSQPYTITMTVADACGTADATSTCDATITSDYCGFIYVAPSANGGNDANIGSPVAPVASITQAMAVAGNSGNARYHIRLLEGNYTASTVLNLPNNLVIEGGYRIVAGEWIKNSSAISTLTLSGFESSAVTGNTDAEHVLGFKSNGSSGWTLQDLNMITTDASGQTPSGKGRSNYAIWINNSSNYNIVRCDITTGAASAGNDGVTPGGLGGAGGNGAGGNGGNGSEDRCGCGGQSGSSPGQAGNGGAGGGGNGGNCCGGGCNWVGCDASGCNAGNANNGQPGTDGGSYAPNDRPAAPTASGPYFIPADPAESGGNGFGGGGGGGGGGADIGTACTCSSGSGRPNGGRGGDGGGGGLGGLGGKGGGSSFAIYRNESNTGAVLLNINLSPGAPGVGGNGAAGQPGRPGDAGTPGVNHGGCDGGRGGNGGRGGDGGNGGRGRDGANGISGGICTVTSGVAVINNPSTAIPYAEITSNHKQGCTNSQITLTSPFSGLAFSSLDAGGDIINNITETTSTFAPNSDPLDIYYTSTGRKDLVISGNTYFDFIHVNTSRTPPSIDGVPTGLCSNSTQITLESTANSPTAPTDFEWTIQRMPVATPSNPVPVFTFNVEDPGPITLAPGVGCPTIYQIKLRVKDECCGWSIPVYQYVSIEAPTANNTITAPTPAIYCTSGDPNPIIGSVPTGGSCNYTYQWQQSINGGPFTDIPGAISQNYDPPVLSTTGTYEFLRIETSGACGISTSNIVKLEVVDSPVATVLPDPGVVCAGLKLQLFAEFVPGTRPITSQLWTGTGTPYLSSTSIKDPEFNAAALASGTFTLTFTVRDGVNCSASASTTVTVSPKPTITNPPADLIICSGQTATYNATTSITSNIIYESVAGPNITGNSGGAAPELGNISDVLVNTGVMPDTVTYTIYPATTVGCSGPSIVWRVSVQPPAANLTATVDRTNFCSDDAGNIVLSVPGADGQAVEWFSGSCGGSSEGVGTPLTIASPTVPTTYYAKYSNCPTCVSVPVAVDVVPAAATVAVTQPSCSIPTGTLTVTAPLGAGLEYNIDGGAYQVSNIFSGVADGSHTILVRNAANVSCVSAPTTVNVNTAPTPPTDPTFTVSQPSCTQATGTITVTAPLGADFEYNLDGGAYQSTLVFAGITPGSHTLIARRISDNTCLSQPVNVVVDPQPGTPSPVVIDTAICSGGSYTLPDGTVVNTSNTYVVTLTSSTGCDSLVTTNLTVNALATVTAGADIEICESNPPQAITLSDGNVGGGATTGAWSIDSGGGSLSNTSQQNNAGIVTTTYTPAAGFNGVVVLSLTTEDPSGPCGAVSATKTITIKPIVTTSPITHD